MKWVLIFSLILSGFFVRANADELIIVKTHGPQKEEDASHSYFVELLSLALNAPNDEKRYQVEVLSHPGQGRVMRLLAKDEFYDVAWSGYSIERSKHLIRVPFPLFNGALGVRGSIVRKDENWMAEITNISDLSNKLICQGIGWPDAAILKEHGLKVIEISQFDSMLKMIELSRCDLLPLSVFEGKSELDLVQAAHPNLKFSTDFLITYYQEMNFYVSKNKSQLANRLLKGLGLLKSTGEIDSFMMSHSLTKNAFPASQFHRSVKIKVDSGLKPDVNSTFYFDVIN